MDSTKEQQAETITTFSLQSTLPRLPVPSLEETVGRFLEWTEPLLTEEQREKTARAAEEFLGPSGEGTLLQKALEEHASREDLPNWLEPFWNDTYLCSTSSLPICSNIFYVLDLPEGKEASGQVERAAALALRGVAAYLALREESFPPSMEGKAPLCMSQYRLLFGASRTPRKGRDFLRNMTSPEENPVRDPRHMMVIRKGRFYRVPLLDSQGRCCSLKALQEALRKIVEDPRPPLPDEESLGLFTAGDRDSWARGREMLLEHAPEENGALLRALEESLFVMALDHEQPATLDDLAAAFLHGDGRSRWFEKTLQFMITPRGEGAINMEHSVTDGSIMSTLGAYLTREGEPAPEISEKEAPLDFLEMIPVFSPEIRKLLRETADAYDELCSKTPLKTLVFEDFGKEVIKSLKVSPDGFVQMGLQLARYRTFGNFCNSYEPVMTRGFLHGRTEAIRTVSLQSCRFVTLMEEGAPLEDRALALREAVEEHVRRAKLCRKGHGVDRHLYGLLQMYRRKGDTLGVKALPSLFLSPGWHVLVRNVLSTSTSAPKGLQLAGFGPVVEEGFGVRYLVFPEKIHFCLSSRVHLEGSLERFRKELLRGYREMRELLEQGVAQEK